MRETVGSGSKFVRTYTVRRIHLESGSPLDKVQSHVVGWLELVYEPGDLDEDQMEEFDRPLDCAL